MTSQPDTERLAPPTIDRLIIQELTLEGNRATLKAHRPYEVESTGVVLSVEYRPQQGWAFKPGDWLQVEVTPYRAIEP